MIDFKSKIFIAGHNGMVGSAICRLFALKGYKNLITLGQKELDLRIQADVLNFFNNYKPDCVLLAAAKVGGIQANINSPAEFLYDNLMIQNNIINASWLHGVKRLIFLGSSCIYPKECRQPMREEYLLTGPLEPTNEGYAIAKIAGLKLSAFYKKQYGFNAISLMPCNLYGPNDSFDLQHSHVLSALVKRFADAVSEQSGSITLWGTGIARREFMHVDDIARAIEFFLNKNSDYEFINIGWGEDISIKELATVIAQKTGFKGTINWDSSKPDGMLRKCMDVGRMKSLGFKPAIKLQTGIDQMIEIYQNQIRR